MCHCLRVERWYTVPKGEGCGGGFAAVFIGCFAEVVGALKYGRLPHRRRQKAVFIFIARRVILNPQPRSGCQS